MKQTKSDLISYCIEAGIRVAGNASIRTLEQAIHDAHPLYEVDYVLSIDIGND
jgi:hypothetical protein